MSSAARPQHLQQQQQQQHSSSHQQHQHRTRATSVGTDSDAEEENTAKDDGILLFGIPDRPSPVKVSSRVTAEEHEEEEDTRTTALSDSDTTSSSRRSPVNMTASLFPSHEHGVFDSLQLSEAPSLYASMIESPPTDSEDDLMSIPTSDQSSTRSSSISAVLIAQHRNNTSSNTRNQSVARSSSFSEVSRPSRSGSGREDEVGGSWEELTEDALSRVNGAATHGEEEAVFTSDSSEDESLAGGYSARRRSNGQRGIVEEGEVSVSNDEPMSRTPRVTGVGFTSMYKTRQRVRRTKAEEEQEEVASESTQNSYPTPPPESSRRSRPTTKRRHRTSGRVEGSQKKSSASGSVGMGEEARRARNEMTFNEPGDSAMRAEREWKQRRAAEKNVFLGRILGRMTDIETLQLIADTPPSRSVTPKPISSSYRHTRAATYSPSSTSSEVHGFEAFAKNARDEMGMGDFHYRGYDADMYDVEESGDETEMEGMVTSRIQAESMIKLPLYRLGAPPSSSPELLVEENDEASPRVMRRTSSLSLRNSPLNHNRREENESWNTGDFEAALGYWRRVLRRIRGY